MSTDKLSSHHLGQARVADYSLVHSIPPTKSPTRVEIICLEEINDVRGLALWGNFVHSPSKRKALRVCASACTVLAGVSFITLGLLGTKLFATQDQFDNHNPILVEAAGGDQHLDEFKKSKLDQDVDRTRDGATGALIMTLIFGGAATASCVNALARHGRPENPPHYLSRNWSNTIIN